MISKLIQERLDNIHPFPATPDIPLGSSYERTTRAWEEYDAAFTYKNTFDSNIMETIADILVELAMARKSKDENR